MLVAFGVVGWYAGKGVSFFGDWNCGIDPFEES